MSKKRTKASDVVELVEEALGIRLPVRLRVWDGSEAGAPAAPGTPVVLVRNRRALRHVVWQPGELGVARAYVRGDLDVEGDLTDALRLMWRTVREARDRDPEAGRLRLGPRRIAHGARVALRMGALGPKPARPASESRLSGVKHTRDRDRAAISHHYDLSNDFYALILDPAMAYSSAFWTRDPQPGYGLVEAQQDKLDLVCRKLDLQPGGRMLDIGCGWGSLSLHAAEHYGVHVTGVTLSAEQRDFVVARAAEKGLSDRVDVSLKHFRDLEAEGVDAVASLEMGEHVGDAEYVDFCASLHRYLRPGGRALVQQMSRGQHDAPGGGPFIETYIAPDMHMKPIAKTIGLIADAGLEIRDVQAMREHYPLTVAAWAQALEDHWEQACDMVGEETARVWRLYLAGGSLAFEENRMGVDQILAVRPTAAGRSEMPASPLAWLDR
ncbi:MAG: cyclopropane-fatty-acyl-phospholipid synthase family protein [Nocardioidaceae bacterium]|nr:cyclopropane-fatty-acyl-phospholipid synthase family protein [Nocardioidaceae bacterium]